MKHEKMEIQQFDWSNLTYMYYIQLSQINHIIPGSKFSYKM